MKDQGVTLIELLVVISVIGILAVALGFSYVGWQGKYKVEKAAKDMHTDLMTARSMAITRSRAYFVDFPTNTTYRISADTAALNDWVADGDGLWDSDEDGELDDIHTILPTFPKTVEYTISSDAGGTITFDKRGLISSPSLPSVSAEVVICLSTTADPDYDCIEMSQTRLITGKLTTQISNGGACNATNCVAK